MNKLILIGNGFDLAHGLPTSYGSFMDFFWENLIQDYNDEDVTKIFYLNPNYYNCANYLRDNSFVRNFRDFKISVANYSLDYFLKRVNLEEIKDNLYIDQTPVFEFKSDLFYILCHHFEISNWVDIENIYYLLLTSLVNNDNKAKRLNYFGDVDSLNKEFNTIKNILEKYLKKQVLEKFVFEFNLEQDIILNIFKNSIHNLEQNVKYDIDIDYLLQFPAEDKNYLIEKDNQLIQKKNILNSKVNDILFLDFNYTRTVDTYVHALERYDSPFYPKPIHIPIHGKIEDKTNPINFGFGDEMDDNYKILEKTGDNKYLKNIKSFMYLNNSYYKKLLNWINNDKFQVYVMGHSCGLSDRTMLNTIFEHNNCRSIKVFYHKKNDEIDNFTEIVQNISRHFNKKILMRDKIVDKSLSIPLPQTARFS